MLAAGPELSLTLVEQRGLLLTALQDVSVVVGLTAVAGAATVSLALAKALLHLAPRL